MRVQDVMARHPITVEVSEPVAAAARLMRERNIGSIPVQDAEGRLRGMLTDRDIVLRCVAAGRDPAKAEVKDVMSTGTITAAPGEDVTAALARMRSEQGRGGRNARRHALHRRRRPHAALRHGSRAGAERDHGEHLQEMRKHAAEAACLFKIRFFGDMCGEKTP